MVRLQAEEKMIGFEVTERRLLTSAWNNAIMYDKNSKTEKNSSDWFNYIMLFMNLFIGTQAPTAHHGTTPRLPRRSLCLLSLLSLLPSLPWCTAWSLLCVATGTRFVRSMAIMCSTRTCL